MIKNNNDLHNFIVRLGSQINNFSLSPDDIKKMKSAGKTTKEILDAKHKSSLRDDQKEKNQKLQETQNKVNADKIASKVMDKQITANTPMIQNRDQADAYREKRNELAKKLQENKNKALEQDKVNQNKYRQIVQDNNLVNADQNRRKKEEEHNKKLSTKVKKGFKSIGNALDKADTAVNKAIEKGVDATSNAVKKTGSAVKTGFNKFVENTKESYNKAQENSKIKAEQKAKYNESLFQKPKQEPEENNNTNNKQKKIEKTSNNTNTNPQVTVKENTNENKNEPLSFFKNTEKTDGNNNTQPPANVNAQQDTDKGDQNKPTEATNPDGSKKPQPEDPNAIKEISKEQANNNNNNDQNLQPETLGMANALASTNKANTGGSQNKPATESQNNTATPPNTNNGKQPVKTEKGSAEEPKAEKKEFKLTGLGKENYEKYLDSDEGKNEINELKNQGKTEAEAKALIERRHIAEKLNKKNLSDLTDEEYDYLNKDNFVKDKVEELKKTGMSEEDATAQAEKIYEKDRNDFKNEAVKSEVEDILKDRTHENIKNLLEDEEQGPKLKSLLSKMSPEERQNLVDNNGYGKDFRNLVEELDSQDKSGNGKDPQAGGDPQGVSNETKSMASGLNIVQNNTNSGIQPADQNTDPNAITVANKADTVSGSQPAPDPNSNQPDDKKDPDKKEEDTDKKEDNSLVGDESNKTPEEKEQDKGSFFDADNRNKAADSWLEQQKKNNPDATEEQIQAWEEQAQAYKDGNLLVKGGPKFGSVDEQQKLMKEALDENPEVRKYIASMKPGDTPDMEKIKEINSDKTKVTVNGIDLDVVSNKQDGRTKEDLEEELRERAKNDPEFKKKLENGEITTLDMYTPYDEDGNDPRSDEQKAIDEARRIANKKYKNGEEPTEEQLQSDFLKSLDKKEYGKAKGDVKKTEKSKMGLGKSAALAGAVIGAIMTHRRRVQNWEQQCDYARSIGQPCPPRPGFLGSAIMGGVGGAVTGAVAGNLAKTTGIGRSLHNKIKEMGVDGKIKSSETYGDSKRYSKKSEDARIKEQHKKVSSFVNRTTNKISSGEKLSKEEADFYKKYGKQLMNNKYMLGKVPENVVDYDSFMKWIKDNTDKKAAFYAFSNNLLENFSTELYVNSCITYLDKLEKECNQDLEELKSLYSAYVELSNDDSMDVRSFLTECLFFNDTFVPFIKEYVKEKIKIKLIEGIENFCDIKDILVYKQEFLLNNKKLYDTYKRLYDTNIPEPEFLDRLNRSKHFRDYISKKIVLSEVLETFSQAPNGLRVASMPENVDIELPEGQQAPEIPEGASQESLQEANQEKIDSENNKASLDNKETAQEDKDKAEQKRQEEAQKMKENKEKLTALMKEESEKAKAKIEKIKEKRQGISDKLTRNKDNMHISEVSSMGSQITAYNQEEQAVRQKVKDKIEAFKQKKGLA